MVVSIQYLRAIAASMVMLFHAGLTQNAVARWPVLAAGASGVHIFFVISGFIMWQSTAGRGITGSEFLRRRLARIAPLYWVVTLVMSATPWISGTLAGGLVPDWKHTLASLAFIPWQSNRDAIGTFYPVYVPGWTLNFEMFFYVVFAACLWIGDLRLRLFLATSAFCGLTVIGLLAPPKSVVAWSLSPIILEFAAGLCIGAWAATQHRVPPLLAALMVAAGFVSILARPENGASNPLIGYWLQVGASSIFIVLGAVELERHQLIPRSPILLLLGDTSYALYLTHLFVIGSTLILWDRLHLPTSAAGLLAFLAAISVACHVTALFTHFLMELPLSNRARKLLEWGKRLSVAPSKSTNASGASSFSDSV